jgi:hypothetical protein
VGAHPAFFWRAHCAASPVVTAPSKKSPSKKPPTRGKAPGGSWRTIWTTYKKPPKKKKQKAKKKLFVQGGHAGNQSSYSDSGSDSDSARPLPHEPGPPGAARARGHAELRAPSPHTAAEMNTEGQQPWNSSRPAVAGLAERPCGCAVAVYKRAAPAPSKYSARGPPPPPPKPPPLPPPSPSPAANGTSSLSSGAKKAFWRVHALAARVKNLSKKSKTQQE